MRVASPETDLDLDVVIDPDAEPADIDEALARFLLAYIRRTHSTTAEAPAAERSIPFPGANEKEE
jgi:hypothetical protein